MNNLAALYKREGRYDEAERHTSGPWKLLVSTLGPTHPTVATTLENMASLYFVTGRSAEAHNKLRRSKEIRSKE